MMKMNYEFSSRKASLADVVARHALLNRRDGIGAVCTGIFTGLLNIKERYKEE